MKRVTDLQRPDGAHLTWSYNDALPPAQSSTTAGIPIQGTNVQKQKTTMDGLARPIKQQIADSGGTTYSIAETQYDPLGRPFKVSNPHNSTAQYWTETRLDALGRTTLVIPPDGTASSNRTTYAYSASALTVTDPAGKARKQQLDGLGRLTAVFEPDVTSNNTLTQQTSYAYNLLDQLVTVTQGAQTRTYNYDALGRLASATTPEAGNISYQYDPLFYTLVTQRTDARGVITNYSYDTLNRLKQISYNVGTTGVPATPSVTLTYDEGGASANALGRLTKMADGVGNEQYTHDVLGRTTQMQKTISGTTFTSSYQYNLAGELTQITYPSGRLVQQNYDAIGRVSAIADTMGGTNTTYASGFTYNPATQITAFAYGNGVSSSIGYTPDRLFLQSLSYSKGAQTLFSLNYWYKQDSTNCPNASSGNNAQIQCITDNVDSGRTVAYAYDALYRLSSAVTNGSPAYPQWGLAWTYDRYGNRTAQTLTAGTDYQGPTPTDPNTNRVTSAPYAYDANGNMLNDGQNTLTYDADNRVVTSTNGATSTTYSYDGNGSRVKKVSASTTTVYVLSGSKVVAEYANGAAPASPAREYIYSGSQLLAKIEVGSTNYYHPDHLSVRLITDASGAVAGQQADFPFGESEYSSGTASKWQFSSYERDAESGNDYVLARYYVNHLGRFSSPDPLAGSVDDPQSFNRYAYVRNQPTVLTDPSGLAPCSGSVSDPPPFGDPCPPLIDESQGVDRAGFDEFDALAASSCTASADCSVGYGWEGLFYNSQTGSWGFDVSNPAILYRWVVSVTDENGKTTDYYTFTRDAAGLIAIYWNGYFADRADEAKARAKVDAFINKVGLRPYIASSQAYGKGYKLQLTPEGLKWLKAQVTAGVFDQGSWIWAAMHINELDVTDKRKLIDFRAGIHPSLHVPVNSALIGSDVFNALAHLDGWNPQGGVAPFVLHWICDVAHAC